MMKRFTYISYSIVAIIALFSLSHCFDPDLGNHPFLCAPTGKKCPDNYECNTSNICVPEGTAIFDSGVDSGPQPDTNNDDSSTGGKDNGVYLDGSTVQPSTGCLDNPVEPNNSSATATSIPQTGLLVDWEICYPGDVDHYSFSLTAGQTLSVSIIFSHSKGDLDMALLDPNGTIVRKSLSEDNNESIEMNINQDGKYIVGVWGYQNHVNTYDIQVNY